MNDFKVPRKSGKFLIEPGREVSGEFCVEGKPSMLCLRDNKSLEYLFQNPVFDIWITGTLFDFTEVTLIQCVPLNVTSATIKGELCYYAELSPHFILEGRCHISPNDEAVLKVSLLLKDSAALFYDFEAFGTAINAVPHIEEIVTANNPGKSISLGESPIVMYFTGKHNIIEVDTLIGKVCARHRPIFGTGGPQGVKIDNNIVVDIEIENPVTFTEAIRRTTQLLNFLQLVIGCPQIIQGMTVDVLVENSRPEALRVDWSAYRSKEGALSEDTVSPWFGDLPLNPIQRSEEFRCVMRKWLEKDEERFDARARFHSSFRQQNNHSIERLVGAANMFDILSESAVPKDVSLSEELQNAKKLCREMFLKLPKSNERDSVLNALGRVGKATLKHKTKHRATYLEAVKNQLPKLEWVLENAIDCRNYYVHGGQPNIDYRQNTDIVIFLTETLEFVFAASELSEMGWDIQNFFDRRKTYSHPFTRYQYTYLEHLEKLKKALQHNQ